MNSLFGGIDSTCDAGFVKKRMILAHDCQGDITFFLRYILDHPWQDVLQICPWKIEAQDTCIG